LRVRVWRRLQSVGSVPVRGSAYVLPNRDAQREDLEWIKTEIESRGGQATLLAARTLEPAADEALIAAFREAREGELTALAKRVPKLLVALASRPGRGPSSARPEREVRDIEREWRELEARTFFATPKLEEVRDMLDEIGRRRIARAEQRSSPPEPLLDKAEFTGRTWVTRPRPGIDRMSSAWLIRRFIDPKARFRFRDGPARSKEVPFDTFGAEFGHRENTCTFEVLAARFAIRAREVAWLGRIVHDLDFKDDRFGLPEAAGVGRMVEGLRRRYADDHELLEQGMTMIDALARSFEAPPGGREDKRPSRRK
jgi:hypothetical protein